MSQIDEARAIVERSIAAVLPDAAVRRALEGREFERPVSLVAIGKAAWRMASAAAGVLGDRLAGGVVITKYGHSEGAIANLSIYEAAHPVPDENGVRATQAALRLADSLGEGDELVFLVSGGGSALFESPLDGVTLEDIADITRQLLACGADITQINAVRKHLSAVKGGRFAMRCAPARVLSIVLSDVIGDSLDAIASGPAHPDSTTCEDVARLIERYHLTIGEGMRAALATETPKALSNVTTMLTGNNAVLCRAAMDAAASLGYAPHLLTTTLGCEAREAGAFLAAMAREVRAGTSCFAAPCALIAGGETVVHLRGKGKGGRNQELALAAAVGIDGLDDVLVLALGSDGTDGPTDAAGGIATGELAGRCRALGLSIERTLEDNDAYTLMKAADALIMTGPTGTNVCDVAVALIR